jgi:hypothetical protein
MNRCLLLHGFMLTSLVIATGCTELLLEGTNYHLDDDAPSGPLVCEDGLTTCDDACVRIDSDSRNCGACGHDCFGAACGAGMCETEEIVTGIEEPRALTVDETHVYWTSADGTVRRALKAGGTNQVLASGQADPHAISVEVNHLFWVNHADSTVMRLKKDGTGNDAARAVFEGQLDDDLRGLALGKSNVYVSRTLKGDIRRVDKSTDVSSQGFLVAPNQPEPSEVVLLGTLVAWSGYVEPNGSRGANGSPIVGGGVVRYLSQQGAPATLAEGEGEIVALTSMGLTAVWADGDSGRIRARNIADSAAVTLVEDQDVRSLAADGTRVFWSTANGNVKAHVLATHETRVLAFDVDPVGAVVADATHVYILRTGPEGAILRVAK